MKKCPNCGEILQEHDKVCRNCGAFLDVVSSSEEKTFLEEDFPVKEEKDEQDFLNIPSYDEIAFQEHHQKTKTKFYWKVPVLFLMLSLIFLGSSILIKTLDHNQDLLIRAFNILGIGCCIVTILAFITVIILYMMKKEFYYTMTPRQIIDSNASPIEQRRMAFVGRNYVKISKQKFSLPACLLNWYYLLYRKRYVIAFLGMLLFIGLTIVSKSIPIVKYIMILLMVISSILLGLNFNKRYIKFINKKSKTLKDNNSNLDVETFLKLCQKKGGTAPCSATIIYTLFLITIIIISTISFSKPITKNKEEQKEKKPEVEVKIIDRDYQKRKKQCQSYAQAIYQSYTKQNMNIDYIGCNMGKEKYVILKVNQSQEQKNYIAKYKIKEKELKLINTTLDIDTLRHKQQSSTITEQEIKSLTEKETIEREFSSFDNKIEQDRTSYKEDANYIRNYIKINIEDLKNN